MAKDPQLLSVESGFPAKPAGLQKSNGLLLLRLSPEVRAFEALPVSCCTITWISSTANGVMVWRVLPRPTVKRVLTGKITISRQPPAAVSSGLLQCSCWGHTPPRLFLPNASMVWGTRAGPFWLTGGLLCWAVLVWGSPLAWTDYLRAALPLRLFPPPPPSFPFPSRVRSALWALLLLLLPPHLPFICISPNTCLASLILFWHPLLRGCKLTWVMLHTQSNLATYP